MQICKMRAWQFALDKSAKKIALAERSGRRCHSAKLYSSALQYYCMYVWFCRNSSQLTLVRCLGYVCTGVCCEKKVDSRHQTGLVKLSFLLYDKIFSISKKRGPAEEQSKRTCHIVEQMIVLSPSDDENLIFFATDSTL